MKTITIKACLLTTCLSFLIGSPLAIAQSNSAAALVPVISLLLEEQDPCITPIGVGSVVFGRLTPDCEPNARLDSDAAHYFSFTHTGGPLYIESISDFPDSFQSTLNLRNGRGRDGNFVTTPEGGSNSAGNGFGSGRAISIVRYVVNAGGSPSGLPAGEYTIEVGFRASTSGAQRAFTLSVYGDLVTARATGRLNDTGIAITGTENFSNSDTCDNPTPTSLVSLQDCHFGRDSDPNLGRDNVMVPNVDFGSDIDGQDGFSFLKVGVSGEPLPANTTTPHACVKDNVTGLMWEVKTNDDGLHDVNHIYSWYNTNSAENGGANGTLNGGVCFNAVSCDTQGYVTAVNQAGLCSYNDWRMPTVTELQGLLNYNNIGNTNAGTLDAAFFPNTTGSFFWSASPDANFASFAWGVSFGFGSVSVVSRDVDQRVRLVRGGQ